MTTTVIELYNALRQVGVDEAAARAAASAVLSVTDKEHFATKADLTELRLALQKDIAELKADLTWRIILVLSAQTAVFSAIVAALKFVKP